jgi:hypothetical protein
MALSPIETASSLSSSTNRSPEGENKALRGKRFCLYAGVFVIVGSAIVYGRSFIGDFAGLPANSPDAGLTSKKVIEASVSMASSAPQKVDVSRRDVATAEIPPSAQQQIDALGGEVARATAAGKAALERERQRADAVTAALTSAEREIGALRGEVARATASVEVALSEDAQRQQTAEMYKQALDWERQRADTLARELASVREEVAAFTARDAVTNVARTAPAQSAESAPESTRLEATQTATAVPAVSLAAVGGGGLVAEFERAADTKSSIGRAAGVTKSVAVPHDRGSDRTVDETR